MFLNILYVYSAVNWFPFEAFDEIQKEDTYVFFFTI